MGWATVGWLVGLVPLAGVAVYLLATAGRAAAVPFLRLWADGASPRRAARVVRRPPAAVLWGLGGLLLAVLAAGGPEWRSGRGRVHGVVVLDRGADPSNGGASPFRGTVDRAIAVLSGGPARLVCVPPWAAGGDVDGDGWADRAAAVPPTAVDTGAAVDAAIGDLLRAGERGPIVVCTDRPLATRNPAVTRVGPPRPRGGVGIVAMAARERPHPQVMVRLVNRTAEPAVTVRVSSAGVTVERSVTVAAGGTTDVFVDWAQLGDTIEATTDGAAVDGRAYLSRQAAAATVEVTPGTPEAIRRMAAVFDRVVAGSAGGGVVTASDRPLAGNQAGVWVVDSPGRGVGAVEVADHPVTAGVSAWEGGGGALPAGFAPVVRREGRAVVAVRDGPPRQVWAALDVGRMSRSADWVVFLADAFRWAGGGGGRFGAVSPRPLGDGWTRLADDAPVPAGVEAGTWPGVYRSTDGRTLAVNAAGAAEAAGGGEGVAVAAGGRPAGGGSAGGRPLGNYAALAAVGCLAMAAGSWPAARRQRGTAGVDVDLRIQGI